MIPKGLMDSVGPKDIAMNGGHHCASRTLPSTFQLVDCGNGEGSNINPKVQVVK